MSHSMLNLFKMCSPGNCLHAAKVPPTLTCKEGSLEVTGRWLTLWYCLVERALENTEDFSPHDFLQHWMCSHHYLVTTHPRSEKQGTLGTMSECRKKQAKSKQVWSHDRLGHVTRHWHISANLYKSATAVLLDAELKYHSDIFTWPWHSTCTVKVSKHRSANQTVLQTMMTTTSS